MQEDHIAKFCAFFGWCKIILKLGCNNTGFNTVYPDSLRRNFLGKRPGEIADACLGNRVVAASQRTA